MFGLAQFLAIASVGLMAFAVQPADAAKRVALVIGTGEIELFHKPIMGPRKLRIG